MTNEWEDGPDGADRDLLEDEETPVLPCPRCGSDLYEDADRCPNCGRFVTPGGRGFWHGRSWWWIVLAAAGIVAAFVVLSC